jgi:hypothetical protein
MKRSIHSGAALLILCLAFLLPASALAMKGPGRTPGDPKNPGGPARTPAPSTLDQIIQNVGNIRTTVDNAGYIGGYRYYHLPSGEWPRNSGHDYIGEIKYWMGAVSPLGETLAVNTWDEFQPVTNLVSGNEEYKILLSTDSARYPAYDVTDTTGAGKGNPARGWRIWDLDSSAWVYNKDFSPRDSSFFPGGPTSLQESHFRFNDAAGGNSPMNIEVTHTMMQWNYCYNEDFTYVIMDIKNNSANDYTNFCFGLYCDLDIGGPDGTGENGRLGDSVGYDTAKAEAWNTQVSPSYDPGWGPTVTPGVFGIKLLETPDHIGMTALRTGEWEQVPTDAPEDDFARYELISSNSFDQAIPPADQYFIMCTRGINLTAGKTVRVVYAMVAGKDLPTFKANADRAQYLYDAHYVGPQPPTTPTLTVRAGDRKAYLHWNSVAETSLDPLSGLADFDGYKLYRSDNQGKTWGQIIYQTNNSCLTMDYRQIAMFRQQNPGDPMQHTYIDSNLINGVDYWYCLVAFDKGDPSVPVDVLQTGFGEAGVSANVAAVRPGKNPAGFFTAAGTVKHDFSGTGQPSEGTVTPILFDMSEVHGPNYEVVFDDQPEKTYWNLIDVSTGDTVLSNQTDENVDPSMLNLADGLRIAVTNVDRTPISYGQTALGGSETTLVASASLPPTAINSLLYGETFGDAPYRCNYELRYTTDSSLAFNVVDPDLALYKVPFEVWNTTTNTKVCLFVRDGSLSGSWHGYNSLTIVDHPYDTTMAMLDEAYPYEMSWIMRFDTAYFHPVAGDRYTIEGPHVNGPGDKFAFKVDGVDAANAARDMAKIKVVPDPYFAQYSSMVETSDGQSVIEFQNVPDNCTIRIYTLSGDLVQTLIHDTGTGTARWNLLSSGQQQVASGVYIYHVESPYGEKLGRFSVIK